MIDPFVSAAWLADHRDEVVVCDVRWSPQTGVDEAGYAADHIAGARFVDLDAALAAPPTTADGRHPLPDPAAFARAMSALGIGDGTTVVAYDAVGGFVAARLVWMLRALGESAALLDGDLAGWDGPRETGPDRGATAQATFTARSWPNALVATIDETAAAAAGDEEAVIDARPGDRFRGEIESPLDPRPGHIPGARWLAAREHLAAGRVLDTDRDALAALFADAGITAGRPYISSCGSGVSACHNLLVAEQLGLGRGRLYAGSWSQYAADPSRPVETGAGR